MTLRTVAMLALVSLVSISRAEAQVPACEGDDPEAANRALAEGDRAADRAVAALQRHHAADAEVAWNEALAAYDRACAAGEDQAIERRAIPLFRLGRVAEAATQLDTFLADHPLDQLAPADARRIGANLRAIERRVATLVITPTPADATVSIDGVERGVGAMRVRVAAETSVIVVVRAPGYTRFRLASTYGVGEHEVRADLLASDELAPEDDTEAGRALPQPPLMIDPAGQVPVLAVYRTPRRPRSIPGYLIGGVLSSVIGAGALVIGSIATHFWVTGQDAWGDPGSAGILGVPMLVGGGILAGLSIWFFYEHVTRSERESSTPPRALRCAPSLGGLACLGTF